MTRSLRLSFCRQIWFKFSNASLGSVIVSSVALTSPNHMELKTQVILTPWMKDVYKGRSETEGEECVQYGFSLLEPKAAKLFVNGLCARYEQVYHCHVNLRTRRQNKRSRLQFENEDDEGKWLRATLYPMACLQSPEERVRAMAKAEKHFDGIIGRIIRDEISMGEDVTAIVFPEST